MYWNVDNLLYTDRTPPRLNEEKGSWCPQADRQGSVHGIQESPRGSPCSASTTGDVAVTPVTHRLKSGGSPAGWCRWGWQSQRRGMNWHV